MSWEVVSKLCVLNATKFTIAQLIEMCFFLCDLISFLTLIFHRKTPHFPLYYIIMNHQRQCIMLVIQSYSPLTKGSGQKERKKKKLNQSAD